MINYYVMKIVISGNNNEYNSIIDSGSAVLTDLTNNNNIPTIEIDPIEPH